jgi:GDP-4-dehydro-6-deoxy-D-mannose reductase
MTGTGRVALITGAGGFVGRQLVAELERETAWDIVGIGLRQVPDTVRARMLACDLQNRELLQRTLDRHRPDVIFHLAAQSYVPKSIAAPGETLMNNVLGQVNLLEGCRAVGLDPTILIVGSADQYGLVRPDELPITEEQPFRPGNAYAVSKITQDMLGYQYWLSYGMKIIRVRPFNHFGPGQSDRFVLANFARQIAEAERGRIEPTVLVGSLEAERDFLDVRDITRAYRLAIDRAEPGEVYNIASGSAHRIGDLLDRLLARATMPLSIRQDPARMRPSDSPRLVGDATRFRQATGWEPRYDLDASLADTLTYWRALVSGGPSNTKSS